MKWREIKDGDTLEYLGGGDPITVNTCLKVGGKYVVKMLETSPTIWCELDGGSKHYIVTDGHASQFRRVSTGDVAET